MQLKFDHVNCIYDADTNQPVHALEDVTISVGGSAFIGLIGHTGSGKSTLVQHANGLIRPTSGRILADGEDIWQDKYDRRALRAHVGLVFQYPEHQLFEADVLSDVCFGPKNLGLSAEEGRRRAEEALRQVGVDDALFSHSPFDLSGGQKRRVAIAGVLAMEPEILILDEPTAGLDPRGRREILKLIRTLQRERDICIILVSHSMEDVARYADRIIVMDRGHVCFDDTPREVFSHPEELVRMGLDVPEPVRLLMELKEQRFPEIDTYAATAEEAAEKIAAALRAHAQQGGTPC